MRIANALLATRRLPETAEFYERVLGLPVVREPGEATVTVGASLLVFQAEADAVGAQHLAFTVPTGSFAAARGWLEARVELFERDGAIEFEGPSNWNSRSLYFAGPDDCVLELIERRDLDNGRAGAFGPDSLLCVSEVGVAVPSVVAAIAELEPNGVRPYGDPPGDDFAAVGDVHGLVILVSPNRPWFPTSDHLAAASRVRIHTGSGRLLRF